MIGKRIVPFAFSEIAILVVCCFTAVSYSTHAAESEIPAVLQFARQYQQQQQMNPPVYHPRTKPRVIKKTVKAAPAKTTQSLAIEQNQFKQLQKELMVKDQLLAQKNAAIQQLELNVAALQKASNSVHSPKTPLEQAADQALIDLKNVTSLVPSPKELTDKLKLANEKLNTAHLNETTLQDKLKGLNLQLDELRNKMQAQSVKADRQQQINLKNDALTQQLNALTQAQNQSKMDLAQSRQQTQQAKEQQEKITQQLKTLSSKMDSERKKFAEEKLQLLQKMSTGHDTEHQLALNNKALEEAQEQLNVAQQQQASLQSDKATLQKLLIARPTAEQLSISQLETKSLQTQFDALKLQQSENVATIHINDTRIAALTTAKQASDEKAKALQEKLDATLKQQAGNATSSGDEAARIAALTNAKQASDEKAKALQAKLDATLQQQAKNAKSSGDEAARIAALTAAKLASDEKAKALQAKLDATLAKPVAVASNTLEVTADQLEHKKSREAYAIGVSLGAEILQMQSEDAAWGLPGDQHLVLGGIIDAFQNKAKLPADSLHKTLTELSRRVTTEREKVYNNLDRATKSYLAAFTKKKGTTKSPTGFWYNINYIGDSVIPKNAILDVVVKESLTDGTVITDMDASGTMLTQPISAFPPIFREALNTLHNHGSVTLMVPPKLAYGSKGYPPHVPPNATMIYELRVSDAYPEDLKKFTANKK